MQKLNNGKMVCYADLSPALKTLVNIGWFFFGAAAFVFMVGFVIGLARSI